MTSMKTIIMFVAQLWIFGTANITNACKAGTSTPMRDEEWSSCSQCFGNGTRSRRTKILSRSTNGDSSFIGEGETQLCNIHKKEEFCNQAFALDAYIHNYFPEKIPGKPRDSYESPEIAMKKCLKDKDCCGISHNSYLKWTLRY